MDFSNDRTASLMTPAKLAQVSAAGRKPVSPAAFLDQMAADAGHPHVTRLRELQDTLQQQASGAPSTAIQPMLERLAQSLSSLDFSLLQTQGLWATLTGKSKNAGSEFAAQVERIQAALDPIPAELASAGRQQQPQAAASDRALVELEVEYRALDKIIDQGARWLQDMRNQIKAREAEAAADPQVREQIGADAARCETLVARLKLLRPCVSAAQQVHQQVGAAADRRAALRAGLHKAMTGEAREWRSRMGTLAGAAAAAKVSGLNLDGPRQAHQALSRRLDKLLAECEQLRTQEEALAHSLTSLREQLSAAA